MQEPNLNTHSLCRIENIQFFPALTQLVHDQIGAEHEVHLIDCCYAKGGVLVALHKSDMPKLDEQQWIYYEGAAFNIVPFNLVWADRPTRLIFRKWLDNPNNHIHWEP